MRLNIEIGCNSSSRTKIRKNEQQVRYWVSTVEYFRVVSRENNTSLFCNNKIRTIFSGLKCLEFNNLIKSLWILSWRTFQIEKKFLGLKIRFYAEPYCSSNKFTWKDKIKFVKYCQKSFLAWMIRINRFLKIKIDL